MNMINYVTEYEYAASALILVLLVLYTARKKFHTDTNGLFASMLVCTLISSLLHIFTTKTLGHAADYPLWLNYTINIAYLLTYVSTSIIYLVYVTVLTKPEDRRKP
ncbi:MAG: hypothetical protein ACI4RH_01745, partial [Huintestinicola sp.]